jgi:hypothetical protein
VDLRAGLDVFWRRENFLVLPRLEPRTVQAVASRNTNYDIPAPITIYNTYKSIFPHGHRSIKNTEMAEHSREDGKDIRVKTPP